MVVIKDFDMPDSCENCYFFRGADLCCALGCYIPYNFDYYTETYKNKDCPLIEISEE